MKHKWRKGKTLLGWLFGLDSTYCERCFWRKRIADNYGGIWNKCEP